MADNVFLKVGKILNTHGIKGEVKVEFLCDTAEDFFDIEKVFLDVNENPCEISYMRMHKNHILIKFSEINTRTEAEALKNKYIYAYKSDIPLREDHYFIEDLKGCEIFDFESGKKYGVLKDVWNSGASDVYTVVGDDEKEYYLPIIPGTIKEIDIKNNEILVCPLKGVFSDED